MHKPEIWRCALGATVFLVFLFAAPVSAEDEPPEEEAAGEEQAVEVVDASEARRLAKLLTTASKKRQALEALALLNEVGDRSHPSFHKPLVKMLTNKASGVALRAAEMLQIQKLESEKDQKKLAKSIWKYGWSHQANQKRFEVQTAALLTMGKVLGEPVDAKQLKEVDKLWRVAVDKGGEAFGPPLVTICEYVRLTKDKRLCRRLGEMIDQPMATAVNSPTNPPAAVWEARYNLWRQVVSEAVETLEVLTGQSFKSTDEAKAWFQENEREFGFDW